MKIGTSFTSIENARKNLNAEIPDWDFNTIKKDLENTWNNILGSFEVESNSNEELTKFYTALYRTLLQPRLYSDVNGEYPGFDNDSTIHVANDFNYYGDFATWNSYRTQMPLLALIAPHEYNDMIKSLIARAGQSDWLPVASEMEERGVLQRHDCRGKGVYCVVFFGRRLSQSRSEIGIQTISPREAVRERLFCIIPTALAHEKRQGFRS